MRKVQHKRTCMLIVMRVMVILLLVVVVVNIVVIVGRTWVVMWCVQR